MRGKQLGRAVLGVAAGALVLAALGVAADATAASGYTPKSALINGATVSAEVGIDKNGTPISLEQYAAERAGFTATVVDGATWAGLSAADFAKYQLLVVGDNACPEEDAEDAGLDASVMSTLSRWAPVVMSSGGNRYFSGIDPSFHYENGEGAADPSDPSNPATSGAEHLAEVGLRFAGALPGTTGVYLSPGCWGDDAGAAALGNALSTAGTGFSAVSTESDLVHPVLTPGASFVGLGATDLLQWDSTAHLFFDTVPADWRALAIATDTADDATDDTACGTRLTGGPICGEAVVVFAGQTPGDLLCRGVVATITGTPGRDRLVGTPGRDVIVGLGGDDVIKGKGGADLICGGDGTDTLRGGNGRDRISGGAGNDLIGGDDGRDLISGDAGDDSLYGGQGADRLNGGTGNDAALGGSGRNTYIAVEAHD